VFIIYEKDRKAKIIPTFVLSVSA